MAIATALGWGDAGQIALAVRLAYLFGFGLTAWPLGARGWRPAAWSRRPWPRTPCRSRSWS